MAQAGGEPTTFPVFLLNAKSVVGNKLVDIISKREIDLPSGLSADKESLILNKAVVDFPTGLSIQSYTFRLSYKVEEKSPSQSDLGGIGEKNLWGYGFRCYSFDSRTFIDGGGPRSRKDVILGANEPGRENFGDSKDRLYHEIVISHNGESGKTYTFFDKVLKSIYTVALSEHLYAPKVVGTQANFLGKYKEISIYDFFTEKYPF